MSGRNLDREVNGPELDNKLIRCVRENPAIYDVNHPHYRRNPVRIAIWERIASELNASSRFLQTKWKNIRYNYLQEQKCLETGLMNANVRKRRFTEDLSFLQHTAQTYNVKKFQTKNSNSYTSSDTESNSYIFPDGNPAQNTLDIIEIDHSNDSFPHQEMEREGPEVKKFMHGKMEAESHADDATPLSIVQGQQKVRTRPMMQMMNGMKSPMRSYNSDDDDRSSPLLTPLVVMEDSDKRDIINMENGKSHPLDNNMNNFTNMSDVSDKRKNLTDSYFSTTSNNDSIELYCLSLVDSLRNMSRSERERVKYEFAKILKDAKYKDQS